jgi:hypothetical protein
MAPCKLKNIKPGDIYFIEWYDGDEMLVVATTPTVEGNFVAVARHFFNGDYYEVWHRRIAFYLEGQSLNRCIKIERSELPLYFYMHSKNSLFEELLKESV